MVESSDGVWVRIGAGITAPNCTSYNSTWFKRSNRKGLVCVSDFLSTEQIDRRYIEHWLQRIPAAVIS